MLPLYSTCRYLAACDTIHAQAEPFWPDTVQALHAHLNLHHTDPASSRASRLLLHGSPNRNIHPQHNALGHLEALHNLQHHAPAAAAVVYGSKALLRLPDTARMPLGPSRRPSACDVARQILVLTHDF